MYESVFLVKNVDLNCTFENGSCNWNMGTDKTKSFTFGKGKTPTENTGPYFDHTYFNESGKLTLLFFCL